MLRPRNPRAVKVEWAPAYALDDSAVSLGAFRPFALRLERFLRPSCGRRKLAAVLCPYFGVRIFSSHKARALACGIYAF